MPLFFSQKTLFLSPPFILPGVGEGAGVPVDLLEDPVGVVVLLLGNLTLQVETFLERFSKIQVFNPFLIV